MKEKMFNPPIKVKVSINMTYARSIIFLTNYYNDITSIILSISPYPFSTNSNEFSFGVSHVALFQIKDYRDDSRITVMPVNLLTNDGNLFRSYDKVQHLYDELVLSCTNVAHVASSRKTCWALLSLCQPDVKY